MPEMLCQNCGKQFHVKPSRILIGKGKFCSRECRVIALTPDPEERKERRKAAQRKYYRLHPDRVQASKARWKETRPLQYAEMVRKNRIPTDKSRLRCRNYYYANRAKMVQKQVKFIKKRLATDPDFALYEKLRSRVQAAVRANSAVSRERTKILIGCSIRELRKHLESQFQDGMTWQNHGIKGWHIDHMRPCASFDLSDPEQQRFCFHYSNLQPLWAVDNIRKGDNIYA